MSSTINLDNSAEQTMTIDSSRFGRVVLKVSSETSSTTIETIEMTRSEALDLAMALIEAAKP